MTTAVRAAGLASDWLREAKWAGPSPTGRADWCGRGGLRRRPADERGPGRGAPGRGGGVVTPEPALPDLFRFFQVTRQPLRL